MPQETNYDSFARAYTMENEQSLLNAYYERPAMLEIVGEVTGLRILDAGCGSGPLSQKLVDRGALVSGFDLSPAMIEIARERLGEHAQLRVADLNEPLDYAEDSFDVVMSSLVFHYLHNWDGALCEMRRILRPGGRLILSVNHPLLFPLTHPGQDYFRLTQYTDDVSLAGLPAQLTYWHRPLHEMTNAFSRAGFHISRIDEPAFSAATPKELIPARFGDRDSFISFIFFELRSV